jgi:hypothetical protein
MAFEALSGHIRVMLETGYTVPNATTLDEVMRDPHFRDGVAFLVTIGQLEKQSA